jgi:hypothetical protein
VSCPDPCAADAASLSLTLPILTLTPLWPPPGGCRWQSSGPSSFPLPPPSILRLWGVLASQQPLDISPASFGALANILLPPLLQTETQGEQPSAGSTTHPMATPSPTKPHTPQCSEPYGRSCCVQPSLPVARARRCCCTAWRPWATPAGAARPSATTSAHTTSGTSTGQHGPPHAQTHRRFATPSSPRVWWQGVQRAAVPPGLDAAAGLGHGARPGHARMPLQPRRR